MSADPASRGQLTLNVQLRDDATLDNYLALDGQQALLAALTQQLGRGGEPALFIHGPADTGKSHLLQASCHLAAHGALYLPLRELAAYPPEEVLQGVESMSLVCLDDLHAVLGNEAWEQGLFHLYNRCRDAGCRLLVAADSAPRALPVELPDLRSRLSWGVVFRLAAASDEEKMAILAFRAERRGLQLAPEVASYIVSRAPRSLGALLATLDQLDHASLREQRSLSIPFVKQALGW